MRTSPEEQGYIYIWYISGRFREDFGMISGTFFLSLLGSDGLNFMCLSGLAICHFFHGFLNGNPDSWSSLNKVFVWKVLHKPCFSKNRFLVIRGLNFSVCRRPWAFVFRLLLPWGQA